MMSAQLNSQAALGRDSSASAQRAPANAQANLAPLQNLAAGSKSPYVRSQGDSRIRWQLFNEATIQRAADEKKLIFLHIGYSASYRACPLSLSRPSCAC